MDFFRQHWKYLLALSVLSSIVFILQSIAWPLETGRDFDAYLSCYSRILHNHTCYQGIMLCRSFLSCFLIGSGLQFLGPVYYELIMGFLYLISILLVYYIGNFWNFKVGLFASLALLLYPQFGALFHEIQSDNWTAVALLAWIAFSCHTARHPSTAIFVWQGIIIFLVALIRPQYQTLIAFSIFPLIITSLTFKKRIIYGAMIFLVSFTLINLYKYYNYVRYDDYTFTRGGNYLLFHKMFIFQKIIKPENGPKSRQLADAIEKNLLDKEPYKSYNITLKHVFSPPENKRNHRIYSDIVSLVDRTWGWDSDYKILRDVALEALRKHPVHYFKFVFFDTIELLTLKYMPVAHMKKTQEQSAEEAPKLDERGLPIPTENQLTPYSYWGMFQSNSQNIREPTELQNSYKDWKKSHHLDTPLPSRDGNSDMASFFNTLTKFLPGANTWFILGVIVLLFFSPQEKLYETRVLLLLVGALMLPFAVTCLSVANFVHYRLVLDPLFIIIGMAAIVRGSFEFNPVMRFRPMKKDVCKDDVNRDD